MKIYIITGRPGIGKSTLFNNIIETLKRNGFIVGGVRSPEVRGSSGYRIGFKIVDLMSNDEGWLAKRNYPSSIRVGKYGVVVDDAPRIIRKALMNAIEKADVIGIDEVGPMELKIPVFREMLRGVFRTDKPKILVVHYRLNIDMFLREYNVREPYEKYIVSMNNRDVLNRELPWKIVMELKRAKKKT
jgi:nucleoside-triphosphatase